MTKTYLTHEELDEKKNRQRAQMKEIAERERNRKMGPRYSDAEVMNFAASLGVAPAEDMSPAPWARANRQAPNMSPAAPTPVRETKAFPEIPGLAPEGGVLRDVRVTRRALQDLPPSALHAVPARVLDEAPVTGALPSDAPPAETLKPVPPSDEVRAIEVPLEEAVTLPFAAPKPGEGALESPDSRHGDSVLFGFTTSDREMKRYLARRYFPYEKTDIAEQRFFRVGDNFVYRKDDDLYWALPNGWPARRASEVGGTLPVAGGVLGVGAAALTGPYAPYALPITVGGGAAGGDWARQEIGDYFLGEDADNDLDEGAIIDAGVKGAFGGVGLGPL